MNAVPLTPAEIRARNERAREIVAAAQDHHPKAVSRAKARVEQIDSAK